MIELKGGEAEPLERERFPKLLRQAHDAEIIDLSKEDDGAYAVKLRPEAVAAEEPEAEPEMGEGPEDGRELAEEESLGPVSAAPASQPAPLVGIPARSARFRRGSRGPRVPPPDIQKIGVVEVDPNFKPRIELIPARPVAHETVGTDAPPVVGRLPGPAPIEEEEERGGGGGGGAGGRGRGGRGRGGRGHRGAGGAEGGGAGARSEREPGEPGERGERGERGGRSRRGGRGRGGRARSDSEGRLSREPREPPESRARATPPEPPPPPPPPPAPPAPPARESSQLPKRESGSPEEGGESGESGGAGGESFWSRVKRGLIGE